ncbi:hypothetical protein EVAR_36845_1 [Eumeta japonica]|uniref:Uncharacterized protein n=1 Tax=Eumeta variegata TaxID=151549 RepID=A0A4C1WBH2_EUMVA|nr:hypothetical protein EVAR_36845_1 [Eumeta japonica]
MKTAQETEDGAFTICSSTLLFKYTAVHLADYAPLIPLQSREALVGVPVGRRASERIRYTIFQQPARDQLVSGLYAVVVVKRSPCHFPIS